LFWSAVVILVTKLFIVVCCHLKVGCSGKGVGVFVILAEGACKAQSL